MARLMGVDDGDAAAVAWQYGQEKGGAAGLKVEVTPVREAQC